MKMVMRDCRRIRFRELFFADGEPAVYQARRHYQVFAALFCCWC